MEVGRIRFMLEAIYDVSPNVEWIDRQRLDMSFVFRDLFTSAHTLQQPLKATA